MASLPRLLAEFPLAPSAERRGLLLAIGRASGASLTLGSFGAEPAHAQASVVDLEGEVHVLDRSSGLMLAARTLNMVIYEAQPMQDAAGNADGFAVLYEAGPTLKTLARGATADEATANACGYLEQVVGSLVLTLPDWVAGQLHAGFDAVPARAAKKRQGSALGEVGEVFYVGQRLSTGVYRFEREGDWHPTQVKLDDATKDLAHRPSLRRLDGRKPRFSLRLALIEGCWYGNYHDLVNAARSGFFVEGLRPWPNVGANVYVVGLNFLRYMREHGWRQPWLHENEAGALRLHGRSWMRAPPIPMP